MSAGGCSSITSPTYYRPWRGTNLVPPAIHPPVSPVIRDLCHQRHPRAFLFLLHVSLIIWEPSPKGGTMDDLELEQFRVATPIRAVATTDRPPRCCRSRRQTEPFLSGPIPWRWLLTAFRLRGKALHVAIIL